jgi:glycosyltransferase involved in cell wall biosynthesis
MNIDVVIPAFRDKRVLEAIQSVESCNLCEISLRVIVQIGSSGSEFESLIKSHFAWVEVGNEPDTGIFDAINIGLKKCNGNMILTIGSDDRVSNPECFQLVREKWHKGFKCITTDMQYTNGNWEPIRFWPAKKITRLNYILGYQHAHFALFLTPSIYNDLNYFNIRNIVNADYEFFWLLTKYLKHEAVRSETIPEVCVQMQQGGNSSSSVSKILIHQIRLVKFAFSNAPILIPAIILLKWVHKMIQFINCKNNKNKSIIG